jgi:UTP--glucose-1-phosphate uridylyltransferase
MSERSTEPSTESALAAFARKMSDAGLDARVIDGFARLYRRYRGGDAGTLAWERVDPPGPGDLIPWEALQDEGLARRGRELLGRLVVISLNGGLGTTMKLDRAKSLIPVREGRSFLELTARQVLRLREVSGVEVPWLLMNSFRTRDDSLAALRRHRELASGELPLDFVQNKVPRIARRTGLPLELEDEEDEEATWAPPGHGDVYLALWQSGLLERLLARGVTWAFVSNIDNLGGTVDPRILGFMERAGTQFAMEVTDKSPADVKGGTLVRHGGRLMLLERAQVEAGHEEDFTDLSLFPVFNTNSLWWRLDAMLERLEGGGLELPMIVNPKTVAGQEVVQLETAMGAAVGSFERSVGIHVPRARFAPVKATCDLLAVRSDAYVLDEAGGIRPSPARDAALGPPVVVLDDRFYRGAEELEARFPHPVSLARCRSLTVEGDLRFGRDVAFEGEVVLRNAGESQREVPDGKRFASGTYEL